MRPRFAFALLLSLTASLPAQDGSVAALMATVRAGLRDRAADRDLAQRVDQVKLTEKLDAPVIEELQSEGAGPETLDALDRQQELSAPLPLPAHPPGLFEAPAPLSEAEQKEIIEKTREFALRYTETLPNFLCTETVRRFQDDKKSQQWKPVDTLAIELAFSAKGEQYRLAAIDGRPTNKKLSDVGGVMSNGEFGTLLNLIFEPKSFTRFRWERWTRLRGRLAYVFTYHIDRKNSKYSINLKTGFLKRYQGVSAMRGLVYIDRESGQVMRLGAEAEGIPAGWPIVATPAVLDYDYADIGGQKYLLPRRLDSRVILKSAQTRNRIEFTNYRKFSAETNLTFDK